VSIVIACGLDIAGDRRVMVEDGAFIEGPPKIALIDDGIAAGIVGDVHATLAVFDELDPAITTSCTALSRWARRVHREYDLGDAVWEILILHAPSRGGVITVDHQGAAIRHECGYAAIGATSHGLVAVRACMDAYSAVLAVCAHVDTCGGEIDCLSLIE